jgi:hypothetical protein
MAAFSQTCPEIEATSWHPYGGVLWKRRRVIRLRDQAVPARGTCCQSAQATVPQAAEWTEMGYGTRRTSRSTSPGRRIKHLPGAGGGVATLRGSHLVGYVPSLQMLAAIPSKFLVRPSTEFGDHLVKCLSFLSSRVYAVLTPSLIDQPTATVSRN